MMNKTYFFAPKNYSDEIKASFPEIFADTPADEILPMSTCNALSCCKAKNLMGCDDCPYVDCCELYARSINDQIL